MGIAALGIAIVYLLVLVAVGVGALWVVVWLFGEAPGEGARTGLETVGSSSRSADCFGAGSTPSASVGPGRSEGKAAWNDGCLEARYRALVACWLSNRLRDCLLLELPGG